MNGATAVTKDDQVIGVNLNDPGDRHGELKRLGGSQSDGWNNAIIAQVASTLCQHEDPAVQQCRIKAALAGLLGIEPKDEIESMIAAQLVASHNAAMECFRRATISGQSTEGRQLNLSQANKLSRTHATLVEALNRHRGKGQQKVVVEHVHVYQGGQAIVGAVEAGGGSRAKTKEQCHAQVAHAPEPPLPCAHPRGDVMSVARDEEWPLPHARRQAQGRAEGK